MLGGTSRPPDRHSQNSIVQQDQDQDRWLQLARGLLLMDQPSDVGVSSAHGELIDPTLAAGSRSSFIPTSSPPIATPIPTSNHRSPVQQQSQQPHDGFFSTADGHPSLDRGKKKASQGPRLRKACDACSKRKVKVGIDLTPSLHTPALIIPTW